MASKTDISNRALSKLGETRVANVDTDDTKKAKVIRFMWDIVRDSLITAYPWNFAIKRTQLAIDGSSPSWGFANQYTLPVDFLALLEIQNNPNYRIEGGFIVTDEGTPIKIRYISRVTDTGNFDPLFIDAFATRLAFEGCEEITQSNTKKQILAQEFQVNIAEAYASDAIQDPALILPTDEWLLSRETTLNDDINYNL